MNNSAELQTSRALPGRSGREALRLFIRLLMLCLAGILAACSPASALSGNSGNAVIQTSAPETTAPETSAPEEAAQKLFSFRTTDLDGNPVDESIFEGYDLVMLNFWAYWCSPCVQEMPELEKIHREYPNLLLLGVIVDDSNMQETRSILETTGVTYPVLYPEGDLAKLADNCQYIPATFFLRPNGMLIGEPAVGGKDYSGWKKTVEGLLK